MKNIFFSIFTCLISLSLTGCNTNTDFLETTKVQVDPSLETYERNRQMPAFDLINLFEADQIVKGTVVGILPGFYFDDNLTDNPHVITNVVIDVKETLKGDHHDKIAVMRIGGVAQKEDGEIIQVITNAPHYTKNEEVLLFLKKFNVYDPPKGFKNENHFYLKAYGKWEVDHEEFILDYEDVQSTLTIDGIKEKINSK